jgi:hypothetical protein
MALTIGSNPHQGYHAEGMLAALAASAGLDVQFPRLGHGIDMSIFKPGPNGTSGSRQITAQVKSWSTGTLHADQTFHYPLKVSAYNYLAGTGHDVRHYLVLCIAPPDGNDYADATAERLRLRQALYWYSLRHEVPDNSLDPESTKTVYVPRTQMLTPVTLRQLIDNNEHLAVVP